ncbi:MAG TPA: ATP-binding protein [Solirubrobacterales bacterium]|jgi:DNA replication protein DnaC|nr:ATP-binding protein [Solirubrobacterales bacterium]HMU26619.1 ATP-binding protein [Solirubrobacterales bacterium]HMX70401.1 ATP-binding protein [Solirubrobacterales bacterium]HMY26695.1 ATP-binding protein [Solirubrobacterales bacterium]HNA24747.1 ATP-binding protein [Solirubrobacterales bacterium]
MAAGEFEASGNGQPPCPYGACDGNGWILNEDGSATECRCRQPRLAKARASGVNSVLPKRYRGVSFDRPPVTEIHPGAVTVVRDWIERLDENLDQGNGLWLMGDTGTGKTTLAMLVSKEALRRDHTVAIYSMPSLLTRIRATYGAEAGEESYDQFFERLCEVDLLHIDDLGAEKQTEWVLEQLYALVNERYEREKSIVVTTNITDQGELEQQIGPRTVSRLTEMCGESVVPLFGEDARQKPQLRDG